MAQIGRARSHEGTLEQDVVELAATFTAFLSMLRGDIDPSEFG